ncbi:hypothetical protein KYG33_18990 [Chryseobacterium sp. D764]|uniref:hypothetical protein n=1 Tax=unclassified Chryseobacterium TaxID=2593645 RepID=UPI0015C23AFC|nr:MULTISPECIES: hypothetical protein [unclassified Chryseobacterium]QXU48831.1 hypothetical protein KYG33_18990 [Chryseobacterium sp. D764]CAD0223843.1 conserved exported protein of unknown function [Chryseobacterium sp. JV274]
MKLIKILPFLLLLFLFNCGKLATTSEDKKSVNEVLKFYGGYVETMKGVQTLNGKSGDFFEVEIKDSKLINSQPQRAVSNAANIAFIVFQNQKPGEYDVIKTKLLLSDGASFTKSFTRKELQEVKDIYPEIDKINSFLINKDDKGILEMFEPKFKPKKEVVKETISRMDSELGPITEIQFQGFEFLDNPNLGQMILIREVSKRDKVFPFINVAFDRKTKKMLNIEFP